MSETPVDPIEVDTSDEPEQDGHDAIPPEEGD
jgi:hypothetical protein